MGGSRHLEVDDPQKISGIQRVGISPVFPHIRKAVVVRIGTAVAQFRKGVDVAQLPVIARAPLPE